MSLIWEQENKRLGFITIRELLILPSDCQVLEGSPLACSDTANSWVLFIEILSFDFAKTSRREHTKEIVRRETKRPDTADSSAYCKHCGQFCT